MRLLHLTQDLIFTDHHGIKACCDMEQMIHCLNAVVEEQVVAYLILFHTDLRKQRILHPPKDVCLVLIVRIDIHLRPVAGRQKHALRDARIAYHFLHDILLLFFRKSEQFTNLDRRFLMADTDNLYAH